MTKINVLSRLFGVLLIHQLALSDGFVPAATFVPRSSLSALKARPNTNINPNKKGGSEDGEVGAGPNWIERSFPVDVGADDGGTNELKKVEDYNLGISGVSFQTGGLSKRKTLEGLQWTLMLECAVVYSR